ncbi:MAG: DUF1499 domain-containing protein [Deltaproteobacteria bacterium]
MTRPGAVLAALVALAGCGGPTDPTRLPSPGTVIHLLEQGSAGNVAVTADGAADPRLRPHVYPLTPVQTAHAIVDAVDSLPRWDVVAGKDGVIWATRRTRLFRFVDDIYLLLLPAHDSTVVFARSASRVGRGDLGQNRRNLGELWAAIDRRLRRAP